MTRDLGPLPDDDPGADDRVEDDERRMRPLGAAAPALWAMAGLVAGWLLKPISNGLRATPIIVSWVQPMGLLLVAAMVATTAWHTWQSVQVRRERLEPHRAVNRLVLGRAATLVGAFVAGGYLGHLVSWLGSASDQAGSVMLKAGLAALAAALVTLSGVWLERACRNPQAPLQA